MHFPLVKGLSNFVLNASSLPTNRQVCAFVWALLQFWPSLDAVKPLNSPQQWTCVLSIRRTDFRGQDLRSFVDLDLDLDCCFVCAHQVLIQIKTLPVHLTGLHRTWSKQEVACLRHRVAAPLQDVIWDWKAAPNRFSIEFADRVPQQRPLTPFTQKFKHQHNK